MERSNLCAAGALVAAVAVTSGCGGITYPPKPFRRMRFRRRRLRRQDFRRYVSRRHAGGAAENRGRWRRQRARNRF